MTTKVTNLLLIAVLFLVQSEAKPLNDNERIAKFVNDLTLAKIKYNGKPLLPAQKELFAYSVLEYTTFSNVSIHEGKKIFQNVLKDGEILANPSNELETQLADIRDFIELGNKAENKQEDISIENFLYIHSITQRFRSLLIKYDKKELEHPSAAESLIQVALEKNGLPAYLLEFNKRCEIFFSKMEFIFDKYFNQLTTEQREGEWKLFDYYTSLKAEQDIEKKIKLFDL